MGLFAEIRAILKQVAQELGQWGVKQSQLEIPGHAQRAAPLADEPG